MSFAAAEALTAQGNEAFVQEKFVEAAALFERACTVFPQHPTAWKGLGHALLSQGRSDEAARAFDRAIGISPSSATALWGGAIAHADLGHTLVAKNYLTRALVLQPTWFEVASTVPQLASIVSLASRTEAIYRQIFGGISTRTFHHRMDRARSVAVATVADRPTPGRTTHISLGLCDHVWPNADRPRVEVIFASNSAGVGAQIVANVAFHLRDHELYPEPGAMVRDLVAAAGLGELSARFPHVYFMVPRAWQLSLPLEVGPPTITLAHATLITEAEYAQWKSHGPPGLDYAFLQAGVDVTDANRRSAV